MAFDFNNYLRCPFASTLDQPYPCTDNCALYDLTGCVLASISGYLEVISNSLEPSLSKTDK